VRRVPVGAVLDDASESLLRQSRVVPTQISISMSCSSASSVFTLTDEVRVRVDNVLLRLLHRISRHYIDIMIVSPPIR